MTLIRRPTPLADVVTLRDALERLFDERFLRPIWPWDGEREAVPALDLYTTQDAVMAKVALPGVKPEDLDVSIQQNTLTLKGQLPAFVGSDEQVRWLAQEITPGHFERSITFPKPIDADHVECTYEHGVLTLWLPITEESRPKHISVRSGSGQPLTVESSLVR